jgi:diacylglycerol kinase (ATP)
MKKIRANLIYNPASGQIWNPFKPEYVKEYLTNKGWDLTISKTESQGDGTRLAHLSVREKYDVVIAAGGDGTINEVVQGLAGSNTVLAILPVGTTNVLARELNIPLNFQDALTIIPDGEVINMDLGLINNRYFLLMVGIGFDAQLVNEVDSNLKKFTGMIAFAATSPVTMIKHKPAKMVITIWDKLGKKKKLKRNCYQVLISNVPTYATDLVVNASASFNDGLLDIDIFKSKKLHDFAWKMLSIALRKKSDSSITESYTFSKMTIKSSPPTPVQLDGDGAGYTPASIEVKHKFLRIIRPVT